MVPCVIYFLLLVVISKADLDRDHQALVALKNSFVDSAGELQDWTGTASAICSWKGVSCDTTNSSVVKLELPDSNLGGVLAPDIVSLRSLTHLSFQSNLLQGEIPRDLFSKLDRLENVSLADNNFSGTIPASLGSSTLIRHLDLHDNNLTGEIPSGVCQLRDLQKIFLATNKFEGEIPHCLGALTELEVIGFMKNNLSGSIPPSFQHLTKLHILDVSENNLSGAIPPELGMMSSLEVLFVHYNNLAGSIPPQLGNLSLLKNFDVAYNRLEGVIPEELGGMKELSIFHLASNKLTGKFPRWLAEHDNVSLITLNSNSLTGELPPDFGSRTALRSVDLSQNHFTGKLPPALCQNGSLKYLAARNNQFSGDLPVQLQQCRNLDRLRLDDNFLTGSVHFSQSNVHTITLAHNRFNGSLSMRDMPMLNLLDLSFNYLTGELPAVLETSQSLVKLNLASNRLSGTLPLQLGQLQNLTDLDLSSNFFVGDVPALISGCGSLTTLNLSRNSFQGRLLLRMMEKLSIVDVSHNRLHGEIPLAIGQSPNLLKLDLSYNDLSGSVPAFCKKIDANLERNTMLCWPGSCNTEKQKPQDRVSRRMLVITIVALSALALVSFFWCWIHPPKRHKSLSKPEEEWTLTSYQVKLISLADVLECVESKDNLICRGRNNVYKGVLKGGIRVAVKEVQSEDHSHVAEFDAEVATLGNIRHRNVVKLLASCTNKKSHLLVYEFMPLGNLRDLLHGKMARSFSLGWDKRVEIITGIAEGLAYLHHDYGPKVVHRDVKCDNILLDAEMKPRLGDFGLAKLLREDKPSTASKLAGTHGYIAPEYAYTLKVDERADVYSFGIVVLEVLTGKMATWRDATNDLDLVEWVKLMPVEELALEMGAEEQCYKLVLEIALACVEKSPSLRPTMQIVVDRLNGIRSRKENKKTDLNEAFLADLV
ncbi:receptor-like protein kinase 2 [Selaginella moellendorffii]|uniref:receptor-like protein kinase 2 n=1 Tax=Selaginella moellendorffii TaxID=88036 RepID=UPI000D1CE77C|nr:receptor-like protein kinase 2 [Selaginella moellendorffii]|eukprot:XP_024537045.1 receptor-like protein kinase 2 [Selaginella moellendorffii]